MDKNEIEEILESDRPGRGDDVADGPEGRPSGGGIRENEPKRSYGGGAPARRGGGGGAVPEIDSGKK